MSSKGTINYNSFSPFAIDVDDTFHRSILIHLEPLLSNSTFFNNITVLVDFEHVLF